MKRILLIIGIIIIGLVSSYCYLDRRVTRFDLPEGELKAECALPTMVDAMIKSGALDVSVLSTDSVWFGVTYKEDKAYVAEELRKKHKSGEYPEKLF